MDKDTIGGILHRERKTAEDLYAKDMHAYLSSKLPDIPEATMMEIAEYIGNRTRRLVYGYIEERDREWKKIIRSNDYKRCSARPTKEDA